MVRMQRSISRRYLAGFELGQGAAHGLNFRFALVNRHSPSGGREATSPAIATNGSIAGDVRMVPHAATGGGRRSPTRDEPPVYA